MKIYIDKECKCHTTNPDNAYREFDVPFFYGKCQTFIEGYRYCPKGESYTREDGEVFNGESHVAWKPYDELDAAQRQYEKALIADMQNALNKLGVTLDE
jgi:hypothetical protein